jgi:hypothetical protein
MAKLGQYCGEKEANMRNALKLLTAASLLALAACSQEEPAADSPSADMAEAPAESLAASADRAAEPEAAGELAALSDRPAIPISLPKIAYAFNYGFRLAGKEIAPLQQKHADLCEAKGPYVCQIVSLSHSGEEDEEVTGELQMQVASDKARAFGFELAGAAAAVDAEQVSATIDGEDLSKQIVDTEAALRSREALRDRLLEVLKTRNGKVAELVEAERSVAQVNGEIDQAKSWLTEMKGRVAYSRITVSYQSDSAGSFLTPIRNAYGTLGAILGNLLAVLLVISAVVGPLALAIFGIRYGARRIQRRYGSTEA